MIPTDNSTALALNIPRADDFSRRPCYECRVHSFVKYLHYDDLHRRYYCPNCLPPLDTPLDTPLEAIEDNKMAKTAKTADLSAVNYCDSALEATDKAAQGQSYSTPRLLTQRQRNETALVIGGILTSVVFITLCFLYLGPKAQAQKSRGELVAPGYSSATNRVVAGYPGEVGR